MEILFANQKLRKSCNQESKGIKAWGPRRFQRVRKQLDMLRAANTLHDMRHLPGRCHELGADRKGQLSLDLDHPYRLLFEVANDPVPQREDGGLDWQAVTAVRILEVEDTHG